MRYLTSLASRLPDGRGGAVLALVDSGEVNLALTILIENLYEFDVALTDGERSCLREVARRFRVEPRLTSWIDDL